MVLSSCRENRSKEVAIEDLELNEIVHDSLSADQMRQIQIIHKAFSEVISNSLEETVENFKRDKHPDDEIAIWMAMAQAYEKFVSANGHIELERKQAAFELILLRSMMSQEEVLRKIEGTILSKEEIEQILSYYTEMPEPLKIK